MLVYTIFLVLSLVFVREVVVSVMKWLEGAVGISVKEVQSQYVKYPSISVCLDQDKNQEELGFKQFRPLNDTLRDLDFVKHFNNGYVNVIQRKTCKTCPSIHKY